MMLSLVMVSCSSDSKKSDRSLLEKLNGNTYESTNNMALVAPGVLSEQPTIRKGSGQLYCGEDIQQTPAQKAKLVILDNERVVATTTSDQYGKFSFVGKFAKNKPYILKIEAKCGSLQGPIQWANDNIFFEDMMLKK